MSEISEEALAAACAEKVKQLEFSVKQSAFDSVRQELETELAIARVALLALRERAEPVYQLWSSGINQWVECDMGRYEAHAHVPAQRRVLYTAPPEPVEPGWIACSERMPEHGRDVQVFCSDTREQFVAYRCIGDDDFQYGFYEDVALVCNPTHWMPLPEAPATN